MQPYTWFMIVTILLTTPFQCAGEEFQARALLPKLVNAIVPVKGLGLALSALLPSAVFMWMHDAQDPWLNCFYFSVGLMLWWLAYRTGGLEAGISFHVVNNMFAMWTLPFSNFSDMFDRQVGTGSPKILLTLGIQVILVLLVDYVARRRGMVRMSSPAALIPEVVTPRRWLTRLAESTAPATTAELPRLFTTLRLPPPPWSFPVQTAPVSQSDLSPDGQYADSTLAREPAPLTQPAGPPA